MEVTTKMAKILDRSFGVSSPVDLARASLDAELPHRRRRGERDGLGPLAVLRAWRRRHEMRRELRGADDHLLRDGGLDPTAARAEAKKPFWRPLTIEREDRR